MSTPMHPRLASIASQTDPERLDDPGTIVATAVPLQHLIEIEAVDALRELYQRVLMPPAVIEELSHYSLPGVVREWAERPPAWVEVIPEEHAAFPTVLSPSEAAAFGLALETNAGVVLVDRENTGMVAWRCRIGAISTLGVLRAGADRGLFDFYAKAECYFEERPELLAEFEEHHWGYEDLYQRLEGRHMDEREC